jgi:hypothetical protein
LKEGEQVVVLKPTGLQRDVQIVEQATHWGKGGEFPAAVQVSSKRKRCPMAKTYSGFLERGYERPVDDGVGGTQVWAGRFSEWTYCSPLSNVMSPGFVIGHST